VGKDAMKADGTVNRAALPAIFNPEDLNALEQALRIKDQVPGSTVTVLTMGPGRAAEVIREGLYRGADDGILLTDRAFAGSDTLATSYAISKAIEKIGSVDVIIAGRQAIDGDTAQVGPQVAEKLHLPQITYTEEILEVTKTKLKIRRRLERGIEIVEGKIPCVITVNASAPECRPRHAKQTMKFKHAKTITELQSANEDYLTLFENKPYLKIQELSVKDVEADVQWLGLSGSPTKVKSIENVILEAKDARQVENTNNGIEEMIKELMENHTIG
jgi:electron transfer flavoprotein beta subunit